MKRRNRERFLAILLLPIAVPIWITGWILYASGAEKRAKPKHEPILIVATKEQEQEITQ